MPFALSGGCDAIVALFFVYFEAGQTGQKPLNHGEHEPGTESSRCLQDQLGFFRSNALDDLSNRTFAQRRGEFDLF